jgi:hypothetical protein
MVVVAEVAEAAWPALAAVAIVRVGWQAWQACIRCRQVVYSYCAAQMLLHHHPAPHSPSSCPAFTHSPVLSRMSQLIHSRLHLRIMYPVVQYSSLGVDRVFVCDVRISILRHEGRARLHMGGGQQCQHRTHRTRRVQRTWRCMRRRPLISSHSTSPPSLARGLYTSPSFPRLPICALPALKPDIVHRHSHYAPDCILERTGADALWLPSNCSSCSRIPMSGISASAVNGRGLHRVKAMGRGGRSVRQTLL